MTVYVSDQLAAVPATVKGDPTPATSWQWLRNNQPISGATSSTYDVGSVDLGSELSVIQQAINVIGSASSVSVGTGTVADFTPSLMYRGGANGVWYDPSDFSTMFQDAAGTVPVTAVGQPVGLMLDKSKGLVLGSELLPNGDFATSSGWIATNGVTIANGEAVFSSVSSASSLYASANLATTPGVWYQLQFTIKSRNAGSIGLRLASVGGTTPRSYSDPGTYVYRIAVGTASPSNNFVVFDATGFSGVVDDVSVKAIPGNHAFNPSGNSANFPVLSARYNLLTKTEDFSDAVWVKPNVTITPNADGVADKWVPNTTTSGHPVQQVATVTPNTQYKLSVKVKKDGYRYFYFAQIGGPTTGRIFDLDTGSYGTSVIGSATYTSELLSDGYYLLSMAFTIGAAVTSITVEGCSQPIGGFNTFAGDGVSGALVKDADLRVANDALNQPTYQRVNTASDYDTAGFNPYLKFNGVNQWLQTNSIDFTYGDKMFVSAGVRKLSDAAAEIVLELSASQALNNGSFYLAAPYSAASNAGFLARGTINTSAPAAATAIAAPLSLVLTGLGYIGDATPNTLRVNGGVGGVAVNNIGTGTYGNYPLYIGARAGSSLWFNGRLYGLIIVGKAVRSVEITSTEAWLNNKTGAY